MEDPYGGTPTRPALGPTPPLINSLTAWQPNKIGSKSKEGQKKERDYVTFSIFYEYNIIGDPTDSSDPTDMRTSN